MATKNPPWQRDELILALDLYARHGGKHLPPGHPDVVALSAALNALPIHPGDRAGSYRNPAGVSMKLLNFRRLDPAYRGVGLSRGNKLEAVVWAEFAGDPGRLRQVAAAILAGYRLVGPAPDPEPDEEAFPEGRVLYRAHRTRGRSRAVVEAAKATALERAGRLECRACRFCFPVVYGPRGTGTSRPTTPGRFPRRGWGREPGSRTSPWSAPTATGCSIAAGRGSASRRWRRCYAEIALDSGSCRPAG